MSVSHPEKKSFVNLLQEFSIPLIVGVVAALAAANLAPEWYNHWFGAGHSDDIWQVPGHLTIFGHHLTIHFLVNDIFMVFFFGIAAKEIAEACLPGGSLNPFKKALNPLFATLGGVFGPVGVFFIAAYFAFEAGMFPETTEWSAVAKGWGIPTATDIALAWLIARTVFGKGHPAINFLLLLAVADDALGLGIIAIFYGDPAHPAQPAWLGLVLLGMLIAFAMRQLKVNKWHPYIFIAGPIAWCGLILAHLHPALALVFIVPFLPAPKRDTGLFVEEDEVDQAHSDADHSPLHQFEHSTKTFVDFGLFFFALANAGVAFGGIGPMTWIIFGSLVVGKTVGVTGMSWLAIKLGMPLPDRMGMKELIMAGFIAALGLTVALFVSGAAFPNDADLQGQAKMGALFSAAVAIAAIVLGRAFGLSKTEAPASPNSDPASGVNSPALDIHDAPKSSDGVPGALPGGNPAFANLETKVEDSSQSSDH
ncbi:MAG: NhaA family Na+:H+ antiporter [Planctomycetota bacterium]|jgi:NhaA family Na+:H+ antiporter